MIHWSYDECGGECPSILKEKIMFLHTSTMLKRMAFNSNLTQAGHEASQPQPQHRSSTHWPPETNIIHKTTNHRNKVINTETDVAKVYPVQSYLSKGAAGNNVHVMTAPRWWWNVSGNLAARTSFIVHNTLTTSVRTETLKTWRKLWNVRSALVWRTPRWCAQLPWQQQQKQVGQGTVWRGSVHSPGDRPDSHLRLGTAVPVCCRTRNWHPWHPWRR